MEKLQNQLTKKVNVSSSCVCVKEGDHQKKNNQITKILPIYNRLKLYKVVFFVKQWFFCEHPKYLGKNDDDSHT